MLNTKQVREIAKKAKVQCIKTYTEKTSLLDQKRRSVVFMYGNSADANTMYKTLVSAKIPNPVKQTTARTMAFYNGRGYHYVRVISHME